MTSSDLWDEDTAARYDDGLGWMGTPEALDPVLDVLERLADGGRALELAIGTGRVAVPLAARGVPVAGIELSGPMLARLHEKVGPGVIPTVQGDMATATVPGAFSLVYLVFNTLGNLRTQDEQVACFANAARHLAPGGRFVVEKWIPGIRRFPPGQAAVPFDVSADHVGFDTYDLATQQGTSHHYTHLPDGTVRHATSRFRYTWPAEQDLMARLAGLEPEHRWADWAGAPFTSESEGHVSVWRKPADRGVRPASAHVRT